MWELPNLILQDGTFKNVRAMADLLLLDIILLESTQPGEYGGGAG